MIKHKWIGVAAALLMTVSVLLTGYVYINPDATAALSADVSNPAYTAAMDKMEILSVQIFADEQQWAEMLENASSEEYIPATVIINGEKIENVGIRPKGNSSLSMVASDSTTDRYSFKIEFDHYITGQNWLGLDKIAFNNMQGDASYMKEYLSYDIMNYIGVESPLYAFSDISVNGETWGFYLAVECLEESYAQRVYGSGYGKLYKPESMGMRGAGRMNEFIDEMQNGDGAEAQAGQGQFVMRGQFPEGDMQPPDGMQLPQGGQFPEGGQIPEGGQFPDMANMQGGGNREGGGMGGGFGGMSSGGISLEYTDDNTSSYSAIFDNAVFDSTESDYKRVINALEKLSNGEDLENTVDVEAVLRYFAAHIVVVNLDSYISNMAHNYYLYEKDGQLTILPWDYNLAFGGFQSGNALSVVNFPIDTPVSGVSLEDRPLLGKLLEVPEYAEMYHNYLREIVDGYFNSGLFEQTMDALDALISLYVENDPTAFFEYGAYQAAVAELKKLGLLRAESIEGQLNGVIPSTTEGQSANADKLIDTSAVNLSALGSMGAGGMRGRNADFGGFGGTDMDNMQKAMEIIQSAGDNELTEEQLSQLRELGLTDEQITQFRSMGQMFGRGNGNMGGRQGNMGGQRPSNMQGNIDNPENSNFGNQQTATINAFDINTWLIVGGFVILFSCGLLFVLRYKRRNV